MTGRRALPSSRRAESEERAEADGHVAPRTPRVNSDEANKSVDNTPTAGRPRRDGVTIVRHKQPVCGPPERRHEGD